MRRSDRVSRRRRRPRPHPGIRIALVAVLVLAIGGAAIALADTDDHHRTAASVDRAQKLDPAPARHRALTGSRQAWTTTNVYADTKVGMFTPVTRRARYLIYVPDSRGSGVYVIDPTTYKVIRYIQTGTMVQHVVPAWDLRTLYATNDTGNSLTPISPDTGKRAGPNIPVADPYNMYFTPDGRHAIVVEEAQQTLAFRDPHTFALHKALDVHCPGVDHMDFSADGSYALASCEFSGQMVRINLKTETVAGYVHVGGSPQDVKLSPDGRTFYVANRFRPDIGASGVQLIDARTMRLIKFMRTPLDAHGLYVSRDTKDLYVTSRAGGAISVIDFATRQIIATWKVPGTPDMGGVSPDGKVLWLAGRYTGSVYAISTTTGHVIATIPAGISPHGLCVWPQPGRYSTGHTGVMR
ncbi:MAG: YncE family protein [Solirubrobacteraceae bacterium]